MITYFFSTLILLGLILACTLSLRPWLRALPLPSAVSLALVSAALGLLLGGLFFVFTIIAGIKSAWIAVLGLVAVGVAGHWWQRPLGVSSTTGNAFQISPMMQVILLIPFAGLTLIANLKMGMGEFPAIFVNSDTPLYLSQVFSILKSATYPQESFVMAGAFQPYHYGGAATAAFVSAITGIAPHKAMFWVVNPLLALGAFFALLTLINSAVSSRFQFIFGFCLFLPAVFLDRELLGFLSSDTPVERLFFNLFGGLFPGSYDPEAFARGVPGSSPLAGYFLLLLSPLLLLLSARRSFFLLATVIGTLAVFCKMDMMPGIFVILGIACIRHAIDNERHSLFAFSHFLVFLVVLPPLMMYAFGYFDGQSSESTAMSIRTVEEIRSHYDWRWNWGRAHLSRQLLLLVLLIPLALIWLMLRKETLRASDDGLALGLSGVAIAVTTYFIVAIVYVPKTGGQLLSTAWISIPLVGLGLFMACKEKLRLLPVLIMLPFAFIGLQGQIMKSYHAVVAIVLPEQVNEYADNRLIGDALRHIPVTAEDWAYSRYVLSYPDLEKAYQATGFALTRSAWGKQHYDTAGRKEGRRLDLTTCDHHRDHETSHYAAYVDRYADLLAAYNAAATNSSKESFGEWHYTNHGKSEGRALPPNGTKSCGPRPMVVTNDFHYGTWPDSQPQIPGIFGHLAYGVHLRHFPGPDGFNIEGARRIDIQRALFSREFSLENPAHVTETVSGARQNGWSHLLLRKDLDDGLPPVDASMIPLKKLFENQRYAVFEFPYVGEK